jgi:hypothetical protein
MMILHDQISLQLSISLATNFAMLIYLIKFTPHAFKLSNYVEFACELLLFVSQILIIDMNLKDHSTERTLPGWIVAALFTTIFVLQLLSFLIGSIIMPII